MADSLEDVLRWFDRQWQSALGTVESVEWEELPHQVKDSAVLIWNGVTNGGTLFFNTEEPIIAPAPPPRAKAVAIRSPLDLVKRHPYLFGAALSSLVGIYCYIRPPAFLARVPGLRLLARPRAAAVVRPRKLNDGTRLDAVLVIGAERGGLGRELALDLERRGFVVLATVPDAGEVEALERLGRGHIKALVLDPTEPGTIPPLLRSLSTSLSLRFPLHTPGDPFRSAHQSPSLCAVVNCLALATHCSTAQTTAPLGPLEATSLEALRSLLQCRVIASLGVLQGTLPLLRSAPGKASVITLVPASTSRLALPYVGAQSIADGALAAMTDALRREVKSSVSVSTVDVGFFQRVHHGSVRNNVGLGTPTIDLPPHLRAVYAPRANASPSSRTRSSLSSLADKVARTILTSSSGRSGVGAGSWTYTVASVLPGRIVDGLLGLQQRLAKPAVLAEKEEPATRRPLPTPPEAYVKVQRSGGSSGSESDEVVSLESSVGDLA